MKNIQKVSLLTLLIASLTACDITININPISTISPTINSTSSSSEEDIITILADNSSSKIEDTNQGVIKELSAVYENAVIKIDETVSTLNYYKLEGYKALTNKQKKVTFTFSDETIVKISENKRIFTAQKIGTTKVTIVSEEDPTKSCEFNLTVEECYFDRTLTSIAPTWDVTNEMNEENPSIKIDSNLADGIYIRNSDGLKWYVETEIKVHSVNTSEYYAKIGIIANTTTNTEDTKNNMVIFFIDANRENDNNWTNFGVCEVSNGANWAWNAGIGNNEARHNDAVYVSPTSIGYNTSFKMGMLRDGQDCHMYVNGQYIVSAEILKTLFCNYDDATQDYTADVNAMAGFFSFNSVVTFSNYRFTNNLTEVDTMLSAITEKIYCPWVED